MHRARLSPQNGTENGKRGTVRKNVKIGRRNAWHVGLRKLAPVNPGEKNGRSPHIHISRKGGANVKDM